MGWPTRSRWWLGLVAGWWRLGVLGVGLAVLVWALTSFYISPAMQTWGSADPAERRMLRAVSGLLLGVVLLIVTLAAGWAIGRGRGGGHQGGGG